MKKHLFCIGLTFATNFLFTQQFGNKSDKLNSHGIYLRSMDVKTADLNNDGYLDIVLAIEWAPNVILWGNKDGNFNDNHNLQLSKNKYDSEDVAIADFNNDGYLDLIFAAEDDQNHEFYLNDGKGNFTEIKNKFPKFTSNSVLTYDFNNDGLTDILFGNAGQNYIFINKGNGNFSDETENRLPKSSKITQDIALADLNNDKQFDLIIGNEDGNEIWINQGNGIFKDQTTNWLSEIPNIETRKVIIFDVNNDGFSDVFLCNISSDNSKPKQDILYLNDKKGKLIDVTKTNLPEQNLDTLDAVFLDLNADGFTDMILAQMGKVQPTVLLNNKQGKFELTENILPEAAGNYISILAEDFNQDSKKDIYLGGFMTDDKLLIQQNI